MSTPVKIDSSNFGRYTVFAAAKSAAGIGVPEFIVAHNRALAVFLCTMHCYILIMVGRAGASQDAPGSTMTGYANPARLTTLEIGVSGGELSKLIVEVAIMATVPTLSQPEITVINGQTVTTTLFDYLRLLRLSGIPGYIHGVAVNPAAGLRIPNIVSAQKHALNACFLLSDVAYSMAAQAGASSEAPGSDTTGNANPVWAATNHGFASVGGSFNTIVSEAASMLATTPSFSAPEIFVSSGKIVTTSKAIADYFRKRHDNVVQKINHLECSPEFTDLNFKASEYTDATGRKLPCYQITRDGFAFLAMGFTGKRAARFKEAYISAFNEMERKLNGSVDTTAAHNAHVAYLYMSEIHRVWLSQLYPMLVASESPLAVSLYDYVNDAVFVAGLVDRSLNANRKEATK